MTVTRIDRDDERLTITRVASFDAPIERVWELWADPRWIERWWGPPGLPATFVDYDLVPGGEVTYFMTGRDGERHRGLWRIAAVEPPTALEFEDVFADGEGRPRTDLPVSCVSVRLSRRGGGTEMQMQTRFASRDDLEAWLATGTLEGQRAAVAQMDRLLDA